MGRRRRRRRLSRRRRASRGARGAPTVPGRPSFRRPVRRIHSDVGDVDVVLA